MIIGPEKEFKKKNGFNVRDAKLHSSTKFTGSIEYIKRVRSKFLNWKPIIKLSWLPNKYENDDSDDSVMNEYHCIYTKHSIN